MKQSRAKSDKSLRLRHWLLLLGTLTALLSPAALFAAGHILGSSPAGRERLASGAYGSSAASFGRCLRHMHAPDSLSAAVQGLDDYSYKPQQSSPAHCLSKETACFVTAATRESQRGLNAAAVAAARVSLRLHSHSIQAVKYLKQLIARGHQLIEAPAKAYAKSLVSTAQKLCPACTMPAKSAWRGLSQLTALYRVALQQPLAVSSLLHPPEQLASWAPAKPGSMLSQLQQASHTVSEVALQLVPKRLRVLACSTWAQAASWLHMCASWAPGEQPKLTALHGAFYLAHDGANVALHGLKHAAGCACSAAVHAGTWLRDAAGRFSVKAERAWVSGSAFLRYSALAAMTDAELAAHLLSLTAKSEQEAPSGHASPERAVEQVKSVRSWLGSLLGGKSSPADAAAPTDSAHGSASSPLPADLVGDAPDAAAFGSSAVSHLDPEQSAEPLNSTGLSHAQSEDGGTVTWGGQLEQVGQPADSPSECTEPKAEELTGLQHIGSADGGMVTWAGQPEEEPSNTGEAFSVEASSEEGAMPEGSLLEEALPEEAASEEASPVLHHEVQSDGSGTITWGGPPDQSAPAQETLPEPAVQSDPAESPLDATDHGETASEHSADTLTESAEPETGDASRESERQQVTETPAAAASQGTEGQPDEEMDAGASEDTGECSAQALCQAGAEAHKAGDDHAGADSGGGPAAEPAEQEEETTPAAPEPQADTDGGSPPAAEVSKEDNVQVLSESDHLREKEGSDDGGSEGQAGSDKEDIAAVLADAVHSLKMDHLQPDEDHSAQPEENVSADVGQSAVPKADLSKLAEVGFLTSGSVYTSRALPALHWGCNQHVTGRTHQSQDWYMHG